MAEAVDMRKRLTLDGLQLQDNLCTALAWDNFDKNTETLSGKNTLHDTFGIAYQNTTFRTDQIRIPQEHEKTDAGPKRLRRSYIPEDRDIEPYMKKPLITSFVFQNREANIPREWEYFVISDLIWSFSCTFLSNCPMWVGWNSLFVEDLLPVQIVGYMETINLPPT